MPNKATAAAAQAKAGTIPAVWASHATAAKHKIRKRRFFLNMIMCLLEDAMSGNRMLPINFCKRLKGFRVSNVENVSNRSSDKKRNLLSLG
jgi:hypothetical protein